MANPVFLGTTSQGQTNGGTCSAGANVGTTPDATGGSGAALAVGDLAIAVSGTFGRAGSEGNIDSFQVGGSGISFTNILDTTLSGSNRIRISWGFLPDNASGGRNIRSIGSANTADGNSLMVFWFRGVDPTTPIDVTIQTASGSNTANPDPPAVTPATADCAILAGYVSNIIDTSPGAPANYSLTARISANDTNDSQIGGGVRMLTGGAGSAENPPAWGTYSASNWLAFTIAVRPAPPAGIDATGALASQAATVTGAAVGESIATGALAAQAATVAGTATAGDPAIEATGALASQSATVTGTSVVEWRASGSLVAQSSTVTGAAVGSSIATGALAAQAATVTGVGVGRSIATGALVAQAAAMTGAAVSRSIAVGALAAQASTLTGAAVGSSIATGALAAQAATVSGAGVGSSIATGALAAQAATVAGTAHVGDAPALATGALAAQPSTVSGAAVSASLASGALAAQAAAVTGVAVGRSAATGALAVQAATVTGAAVGSSIATGALAAQAATVAGTALVASAPIIATGALAAQFSTVTGTATATWWVTGALAAQPSTVAGVAVSRSIAAGALAAQASAVTGAAAGQSVATGALAAQAATMSGAAVVATGNQVTIEVTEGHGKDTVAITGTSNAPIPSIETFLSRQGRRTQKLAPSINSARITIGEAHGPDRVEIKGFAIQPLPRWLTSDQIIESAVAIDSEPEVKTVPLRKNRVTVELDGNWDEDDEEAILTFMKVMAPYLLERN